MTAGRAARGGAIADSAPDDTQAILRHWQEAVPGDRLAHLVRDAENVVEVGARELADRDDALAVPRRVAAISEGQVLAHPTSLLVLVGATVGRKELRHETIPVSRRPCLAPTDRPVNAARSRPRHGYPSWAT